MLKSLLAHPLTRNLAIDDPQTTTLRKQIIETKPFLRHIYEDWYRDISAVVPGGDEGVLELGSGAGFLGDYIPSLITSEIFHCNNIDIVADATRLPFGAETLRGIVMTDVLHHIPNCEAFFREASRCLIPGGVVAMVEPWPTDWSQIIYKNLHHEPFDPAARDWSFPVSGPLSGANGALPWIIFQRDRNKFEKSFPALQIETIRPMMPFRYLLSGGVSMRTLMPSFSTSLWRTVETTLTPFMDKMAMFALVVVRKDITLANAA